MPLDAVLRPRSLAVVGVSSRAESLSGKLLTNLFSAGYTGAVYPVNPKVSALRGYRCYPTIGAAPGPVDLAVVMVPRDAALAAVDECIAAGVRAVVVITAGFREGGAEGAGVERQLVERVRAAGVRMVGPNCMGVMNTEAAVRLDASFTPAQALPGAVAFASHSGALGVAVLETARDLGLGFSHFVSLGNSADVNVCDLLEFWENDPGTRVILLYLESVPEPDRFLALARRIAVKKPIVAFKGGRTAAGQRAAASHTGALAAGDTGVAALLTQAGVIRADTLEEMVELAVALERAPRLTGRRVAILTNAGGPAIAATDALGGRGLELAALAPATRKALGAFLPAEASLANPVDLLPSATPVHFHDAALLLLADPGVDAVVTITVTPIMVDPLDIASGVAAAAREASKPLLSVFMTRSTFAAESRRVPGLPPHFAYPENAVAALGGLLRAGTPRDATRAAPVTAAPCAALAVARPDADGYLSPADTFAVLAEAGIPLAAWRSVPDGAGIPSAAREIGFPVVLKAYGKNLVHKSELGAVAVGLRDEEAVAAAHAAMTSRLANAGVVPDGYLVQAMITGGREAILGINRDPAIGPLVMCGLGGVAVEVWKDVAFRVAPIGDGDAAAMLAELRGRPLLGAFRGRAAGDVAALRRALVALAGLAAANPAISEADINPLLVLDEGQGCVAVDARIHIQS